MSEATFCSCGSEVVWARTGAGTKVSLDLPASENGDFILIQGGGREHVVWDPDHHYERLHFTMHTLCCRNASVERLRMLLREYEAAYLKHRKGASQ